MFPLHDRTRRLICRIVFAVSCIAPTTGVLAWCASINLPEHRLKVEQQLSLSLGMLIRADDVLYPAPRQIRLKNVQLSDTETDQTILSAREVDAALYDDSWRAHLSQPELDIKQLDQVATLLERWYEDRLVYAPAQVWIVPTALTLRTDHSSVTLDRLEAVLEPAAAGPLARIRFIIAGSNAKVPSEIRLERDRRSAPSTTRVVLDTGDACLPCSMLLAPLKIANSFGDGSRFRGRIEFRTTQQGWEIEHFAGVLSDADLRSLITEQFPHYLTGTAKVEVLEAGFASGRLAHAKGRFVSINGQIGESLLTSAESMLQIKRSCPEGPDRFEYDQLAFWFEVNDDALSILGACEGLPSGTLLSRGPEPLAYEPPVTQALLSFVQMLVPQSRFAVPATRETDWLIRRIPVPSAISAVETAPTARSLRVADQYR